MAKERESDKPMLGMKVVKLLEEVNKNQSSLARSAGVTPTSVSKWVKKLNAGGLDPDSWGKMAKGLAKLGIDPEQIMPLPPDKDELPTDLIPLLDRFREKRQLEAILDICTADQKQRNVLALIVRERLAAIS